MESKLLRFNDRYKYEIMFILTAFLLVFNATRLYGPGITPDSVNMLAAADGLVSGQGFVMYDGSAFTWWPPLLPLVLAGFIKLGFDPVSAIRIFNSMLYSLLIVLAVAQFRYFFKSRYVYFLAITGLLFSVQLFIRFTVLGTEPLFLVFIFLTFIYLRKAHDNDSYLSLFPAAIFTAMASLTRYPGVVLIFTGCLAVTIFPLKMSAGKRIGRLFLYGFIASLPLALWLLRNLMTAGMLTGERLPAERGYMENFVLALDVVSSWLIPSQFPLIARVILLIVTTVAMIYVLVRAFKKSPFYERSRNSFYTMSFFALFYTDFIILTSSLILYTIIDDRFLSPAFPFYLLAIFVALDKVVDGEVFKLPNVKVLRPVILAVCTLWLLYPAARIVKYSKIFMSDGIIDYNTTQWHESEMINTIKSFPLEGKVFSNIPDVLYLNFHEHFYMVPQKHENINRMNGENYPGQDVYLVWSDIKERSYLHPLKEILEKLDYKLEVEFEDGKVFKYEKPVRIKDDQVETPAE